MFLGVQIKNERRFGWQGLCLLMVSILFFGDNWLHLDAMVTASYIEIQYTSHLVFAIFAPILLIAVGKISGYSTSRINLLVLILSALTFVVFLIDYLLNTQHIFSADSPGHTVGNLYFYLIVPLMIGLFAGTLTSLIQGRKLSAKNEKWFHDLFILGWGALILGGCFDAFTQSYIHLGGIWLYPVASMTGALIMTVLTSYALVRKYLEAMAEKSGDIQRRDAHQIGSGEESIRFVLHEIKNYAATARANLSVLQRKSPLDPENERMRRVDRAFENIDNLTRKYLTGCSIQENPRKERIDLRRLAGHCIENNFYDSRAAFEFSPNNKPVKILGETNLLEHLLINLFKNSLEADSNKIWVTFRESDSSIILGIRDNGTGFDCDFSEKYWKQPFSTKTATGGTGVGMTLVKRIVEYHGGKLIIEENKINEAPEPGASIKVIFPGLHHVKSDRKSV